MPDTIRAFLAQRRGCRPERPRSRPVGAVCIAVRAMNVDGGVADSGARATTPCRLPLPPIEIDITTWFSSVILGLRGGDEDLNTGSILRACLRPGERRGLMPMPNPAEM